MRKFSMKKKVVAAVAVAGLVGAGGAAFAYWTSTGSGVGSATTGTASSAIVITDATTITDLAPGVAAESVHGTIKNNNPLLGQNAHVGTVTASISGVTETAGALAAYGPDGTAVGTSGIAYLCSAADYTLATPVMTVNQDLVPQQTVPFSGATLAFNNTAVNQNACQGATVALAYASN